MEIFGSPLALRTQGGVYGCGVGSGAVAPQKRSKEPLPPWLGMGIAHNDEEEDLLGDGEKCF